MPVFLLAIERHDLASARYLFAAAAISDGLDGIVARWFNCKSELGAFLDPFADKLLLISSFIMLTVEGLLSKWLLAVVVLRDGIVVCGYFLLGLALKGRVAIKPNFLGKAATALQLACVMGALFQGAQTFGYQLWETLLYATLASTTISGLIYVYDGVTYLRHSQTRVPA